MTKFVKRVAWTAGIAGSLFVYGGCSSVPSTDPASEAPPVGIRQQATSTCVSYQCVTDDGNTRPWLVAADCTCPYTIGTAAYTECGYELGLLQCLGQSGYRYSCGALPALPEVCILDSRTKAPSYFEDFDPNLFFPNNCSQQYTLKQCVNTLDSYYNFYSHQYPYKAPPVSSTFGHHCNAAEDPCAFVGSDPNLLGIFDPCSTQSCKTQQ